MNSSIRLNPAAPCPTSRESGFSFDILRIPPASLSEMPSFPRTICCAAAIGLFMPFSLAQGGPTDFGVTQYLDGDFSFAGADAYWSKKALKKRIDAISVRGVDTIFYGISCGSDLMYYPTIKGSNWGWRALQGSYAVDDGWVARFNRATAAINQGMDAPAYVASLVTTGSNAAQRVMKFVPSYRMNDAHYTTDPVDYPLTGKFWMDHYNAATGRNAKSIISSPILYEDYYGHTLNFVYESVRTYRLGIIQEAIDRYAGVMSGFELDFTRFQIFFSPGLAETHKGLMTDMVRQVSNSVHAHSVPLIVRVPPALRNCAWAGLEVEKWVKDGLADVVIPGTHMTLSHDVPVHEFANLPRGPSSFPYRVMGSVCYRAGYTWPFTSAHEVLNPYGEEVVRTATSAQILGSAMNQYYFGATALEAYNLILAQDDSDPVIAAGLAALNQQRSNIANFDRRYQMTQPYFRDNQDTYEYKKQLPVPLVNVNPDGSYAGGAPPTIYRTLIVGENLGTSHPEPRYVALRLGLSGLNQDYSGLSATVYFNGRRIHSGLLDPFLRITTGRRHGVAARRSDGSGITDVIVAPTEAYVQWPIADHDAISQGANSLRVTLSSYTKNKVLTLVEAEIGVIK